MFKSPKEIIESDPSARGILDKINKKAEARLKQIAKNKKNFSQKYDTCNIHGKYKSNLMTTTGESLDVTCTKCKEEARRVDIFNANMAYCGISKRFIGKTTDNYDCLSDNQAKALNSVKKYNREIKQNYENGKCLIMYGGKGTGKTHLSASIIGSAIEAGLDAPLYTTNANMIKAIRETWGTNASTSDAIDNYSKASILIIDEIGVKAGSADESHILFDIINARYNDKKPTIIVSNMGIDDIEKTIGDTALDRLREGGGIGISFNWESHRGLKNV